MNKIFVIDDDKIVFTMIEKILKSKIECKVFSFENSKDLLNHEELKNVDLFIMDIKIGDEDGRCVYKKVLERGICAPCLFISGSIMDVTFEGLEELDKNCLFDFERKPIEINKKFINRVNLLLKVSKHHSNLKETIYHKSEDLWNMINYSTFFVVILDKDFNIVKANYSLSTSLGFKNEDDIVGVNWLKFIDESLQEIIINVHDNVKKDTAKFKEFTNDIISINGDKLMVKWFNTNSHLLRNSLNFLSLFLYTSLVIRTCSVFFRPRVSQQLLFLVTQR